MKILFVSAALAQNGSATGVLIGNLIEVFTKRGHLVECLTEKESRYDADLDQFHGCKLHHADYVSSFRKGKKFPKDYLLAIQKRLFRSNRKKSTYLHDPLYIRAFVSKLKKIRADRFDLVIAVCANHDSMEAVLSYQKKSRAAFRTVLMQFDPLTENFSLVNRDPDALKQFEKRLYAECDFIYSAPFILQRKGEDWFSEKVIHSELPAIVERKYESEPQEETGFIDCIYAGDFYPGIREPDALLSLFERFSDPKIRLVVLSGSQREKFRRYADTSLKDRLIYVGRVGEEECNRWLNRSQVLINIGNRIDNQLPSKILNYLCFGKPILNLYAIDRCPTLPYMERYPLCINVRENEELSDAAVAEIEEKLHRMIHSHVDTDFVRKEFETATPEYVVDSIIKSVEEKKR